MTREEKRAVLDAYLIKGSFGMKPYDEVYSKILREKKFALIISTELTNKYSKAIADNGYSPTILQHEINKLTEMQKLRWVDKRIRELKEEDVKVKIEDQDDMPFVKAAFALKAKYIITQDAKHFLSKKEEFKKYGIDVLKPQEFLKTLNKC